MLAAAIEPLIGGELPVRLIAWDGSVAGHPAAPVVWLYSAAALRRILWCPGELGAAQAYVCGDLDVDGDLVTALDHVWTQIAEQRLRPVRPSATMLVRLTAVAARLGAFGAPLKPPASQARLRGRLHSPSRDKAAISHHYDLSNEFYRLILDPTMAYSCGYWEPSHTNPTLAQAQRDKLDRICRKLRLDERPDMWLLDVGCGWGSLSLHAAEYYDAQVLGITLSDEQKDYIDAALAERGLGDRVEIRVQDYRTVTDGPFDAAASIEMGEHVGQQHYSTFAGILHDSVRPDGRVLIQQMSRRGRHPGGGPFIEAFIAPDMHMRPLGETIGFLEDAGLSTISVEAMGAHYVHTVDAWIDNFEKHWDAVLRLIGEEGARVWRLYLAGGRLAFAHGRMGVDQILLGKAGVVLGGAQR
ncbi:cyclopropane-fatty-acyl-phospholipid synthase family protein [Candidatus Mycobacterium wuenschmannii]|uniref:Cyclopropane-fatty-acyl-phospholipid synthase family protein n=1 Tax=Candidatus Mycobacterium wuenschmannii TaxID=3027808 RepID=A0ABY8VYL1_9MYCO|nr:cyclopropane-fatty-acyl-phospholipid synthase family protein [Candidatus Mycobacterium wuenschmannii]WIM87277.1 cyclopropane-fatty-acyl-phospholipid synthase family protein [Candidatus Mycobacterium wuenschmannii]